MSVLREKLQEHYCAALGVRRVELTMLVPRLGSNLLRLSPQQIQRRAGRCCSQHVPGLQRSSRAAYCRSYVAAAQLYQAVSAAVGALL